MTDFCKGCGIKLPNPSLFSGFASAFGQGEKVYEFEEGKYCEKCAKLRVDKKRKEI